MYRKSLLICLNTAPSDNGLSVPKIGSRYIHLEAQNEIPLKLAMLSLITMEITFVEFDLSWLKCDQLRLVVIPKFLLDQRTFRMLMNFLPIAIGIDCHQPEKFR